MTVQPKFFLFKSFSNVVFKYPIESGSRVLLPEHTCVCLMPVEMFVVFHYPEEDWHVEM